MGFSVGTLLPLPYLKNGHQKPGGSVGMIMGSAQIWFGSLPHLCLVPCVHKFTKVSPLPGSSILSSSQKAIDGKKVVVVLDPKRSNAINIGLTVLPPVHIIKTAVLNFDEFAVSKEGIEVSTREAGSAPLRSSASHFPRLGDIHAVMPGVTHPTYGV